MSISLTASENFTSKLVRIAHAIVAGSFYIFDPPYATGRGEWYFPNSGIMQKFTDILREIARSLFETTVFDWRPNGGSIAEIAVMMGICKNRNDAIVHFSHSDGGHFAIEPMAHRLNVQVFHLPVNQRTLLIDVERLNTMIMESPQIKLVLLDQSFKLREQPLRELKSILPQNVVLVYDCSHDSALIAGGMIDQPLTNGADILIFNTHKTLAGPQKGGIGYANADNMFLEAISQSVVEMLQSNCHAECLLPMVIAFKELEYFAIPYAEQIIRNSKAFAKALRREGFNISGESFGYTETHQVHVILGDANKALNSVIKLNEAGVRTNNIEIPGSNGAFGLRLGVQAMTRCGMKERDFEDVARFMCKLLLENQDVGTIRQHVDSLDRCFPRFPLRFSFDNVMEEGFINDFLTEVLR